MTDFVGQ